MTHQVAARDAASVHFRPKTTDILVSPLASRCCRAYILPLCFFFLSFLSFFRRLISEVTELISTKPWYIFTYDCHLKNSVELPWAFTPHGLGQKHFLGPTLSLTEHISATEHDINNRKETSIYRDSPDLVNFRPETAENGWPVFAHRLHFRIGRHCQPYRMEVVQQTVGKLWHVLCSGTSLAYSLEQQNVGRADGGLCHASS